MGSNASRMSPSSSIGDSLGSNIIRTSEAHVASLISTYHFRLRHLSSVSPFRNRALRFLNNPSNQVNASLTLPRVIEIAKTSNDTESKCLALQYLNWFVYQKSKAASFLIKDGLLEVCASLLQTPSCAKVSVCLMASLLSIGAKYAGNHLPSSIMEDLQGLCIQHQSSRESERLKALQCVGFLSEYYQVPEIVLRIMYDFTQTSEDIVKDTISRYDVKRLFFATKDEIIMLGLWMVAHCPLADSTDWDSIAFLIVGGIKQLKGSRYGLGEQIVDAIVRKIPSVGWLVEEDSEATPNIFGKLVGEGYNQEHILQAIENVKRESLTLDSLDSIREDVKRIQAIEQPVEEDFISTLRQIKVSCLEEPLAPPVINQGLHERTAIDQLRAETGNNLFARRVLQVDRSRTLADGLQFFSSDDCKGSIKIHFNGEFGVDLGGPSREFIDSVCSELLLPKSNYFILDETLCSVYPNPCGPNTNWLALGRIFGFAISHDVPIPVRFSVAIYKLLQGLSLGFGDLDLISYNFIRSKVEFIWNYIDVSELSLCLCEPYGDANVDLVPGGSSIELTEDNKKDYLREIVMLKLGNTMLERLREFVKGVYDYIPQDIWRQYTPEELVCIVHGQSFSKDIIKGVAEYEYCDANSNVVIWFWEIVEQYPHEKFNLLMNRWTALKACPSMISFTPIIRLVEGQIATAGVTAATCSFCLNLPPSNSKDQLQHSLELLLGKDGDTFSFS